MLPAGPTGRHKRTPARRKKVRLGACGRCNIPTPLEHGAVAALRRCDGSDYHAFILNRRPSGPSS